MVPIFSSLHAAIAEGWVVYDRYPSGYIVTRRVAGTTAIALVQLSGGHPAQA